MICACGHTIEEHDPSTLLCDFCCCIYFDEDEEASEDD